ncbi:NAD(P)-binding protein [Polychaeton citri CBS 116435]|uniref:NAD(P)-binding protein n=1 Tax=Polychaeton citri CBS 116435 TaxID=1314669 RepID=A0A9P4ULY4_9PEZI|nr:NAD(P)-binding protein [Polychaeton citri CBS 116435]
MSVQKIAIAGLSGKLARLITEGLLRSNPEVQIHGIARNPDKVSQALQSSSQVKIFEADSKDALAIQNAIRGTDVCICCYLGDNDLMIGGQKLLIDSCIAEGVARYIASDWSLDFRALRLGDHPAKDPMKEVAAYLDEAESQGKIKAVHILNGAFMEVVWAPFLGWVDATNAVFRYYGSGDDKIEATTMADAAAFTAEAALDPDATGWIKVLGEKFSVKEMAETYREVYNIEPSLEPQGSFEDLHSAMTAVFQKDPTNIFAWMGMYYQYFMGTGKTNLREANNSRFPKIKPTDTKTFLQSHPRESVGMSYMMAN